MPDWAVQIEATPRGGPHLVPDGNGGHCVLVPLGNAGLGGWDRTGVPLPGFPLSRGAGVVWRPAALRGSRGETLIAYSDNDGFVHLVDLQGRHVPGWPVNAGASVVTGMTAVDLNCDGVHDIAFGTSNGRVWLLNSSGRALPGWPVNLGSQLLWQPTQISLGGGSGRGLVCALNNGIITVLDERGTPLPGWPVQLQFPAGNIPVTADVSGDGQADLAFACQNRRLNLMNTRGVQADNWPVFLDARPVRGSMAVGRLNPDDSSPQIALSTIDSLVYLVNGDGSLAGSWRWPNKTGSLPHQPIIVNTAVGAAVIVATEQGVVHGWSYPGRAVRGFPFQHPGGVGFTPVAGDVNGNGMTELVLLGRSGHLAVYPLSAPWKEFGFWPLPLGDPANSGMFGCDLMPVAVVGEMDSRLSGDVEVPYTVRGSTPHTGIALFYSTNAGFSWRETRNFTHRPGSVIWHSDADLPHAMERQVAVKVTPHHAGGPGECGISRIFQVDNNVPPSLFLHSPQCLGDGRYRFTYAVEDPEGDVIQIQAQYSIDHGETWRVMHLSGTTLEIEPWFYGEPFIWNAGRDLGGPVPDHILIRVRAADIKPGPWYEMEGLELASALHPGPQIIAPIQRVSGQVRLGVRLPDPEGDPLGLGYEYSPDGGESWHPATVTGAETAEAVGRRFDVIWHSGTDLPGFEGYRVQFRALPSPEGEGVPVPSMPFHLSNNIPAEVEILSPTGYAVYRGMVPVSYRIFDAEGDPVRLELEYRLINRTGWLTASGVIDPGPFGPDRYNSVLHWNSSVDMPASDVSDVVIRLAAMNGDTTRSREAGPLALVNTGLPSMVRTTIVSVDDARGRAVVAYEIVDGPGRSIDLDVHYSVDDGRRWLPATVSGSVSGIGSAYYSGTFEWHWATDLRDTRGTVRLRVTPRFDGVNAGRSRVTERVFR